MESVARNEDDFAECAIFIGFDRTSSRVRFKPRIETDASKDSSAFWRELLGGATNSGVKRVTIGVNFSDQELPVAADKIKTGVDFRVYKKPYLWAGLIGLGLLLVALWGAACKTNLLKDVDSDGKAGSYSLGRSMIAFWLVLTVGGFVYIWISIGQFTHVVTDATFTLLGIAGATGLAARVADQGSVGTAKLGFWQGIISDSEGPQLHRLQIVIWTLVLGAIYVWTIINHFALAEFDSNLLILVGIASGVYAGLKTQES